MASLYPSELPSVKQHGGMYREIEIIEQLLNVLPDGYDIYHSVQMHAVRNEVDKFGEIDILVMSPTGNLLIMEIKAGSVQIQKGEIYKLYADANKNVCRQIKVQHSSLISRLNQAKLKTQVSHCLVIPDFVMKDGSTVSIPRERIIDATQIAQLGQLVQSFLACGQGCANLPALRNFLNNAMQVTVDLSQRRDQLQSTMRKLSDGLATWVPRISSASGVIRVQATAGSGKTQLALSLIQTAIAESQSVYYVCYNRPLADHLRSLVSPQAHVTNFHELCVDHYRRTRQEPDFSDPAMYQKIEQAYLEDSDNFLQKIDVLIVDEGQDFEPEWLECLCQLLKPNGKLYLLEDDDQRIYQREKFDLSEAVQVTCYDNYRSPQCITQLINALSLTSIPIQSKSPYRGQFPTFYPYASDSELMQKTVQAINVFIAAGHNIKDIVVVTGKGRDKSKLCSADKIGPYKTRRFTGKYTANGDPVWTEGDLLLESIARYKGQSAPAVVLSEFDFSELSDKERRKLFVGMTRAQMDLEMVLSISAHDILTKRLFDEN